MEKRKKLRYCNECSLPHASEELPEDFFEAAFVIKKSNSMV
jgi:hypothetical protein